MIKIARYLAMIVLAIAGSGPAFADDDAPIARDRAATENVILLHGLGRSKTAMWLLARRLEDAGFEVIRIGYDSLGEPPEQIVATVSRKIAACCSALSNTIHFVGHSLGGLVIRAYLAEHQVRTRGRVVLIGTPNRGTPLVDRYRDSWWMDLAGPTARSLGTAPDSFPRSLPAPDYPVGVIAGVRQRRFGRDIIPGDDDGLVPVESTRIRGMTDFIVVESGHSRMRYDDEVARQTIAFLRSERFLREP